MTNHIAIAVEPLREQSMNRAEEYARNVVAKIAEKLQAAGNDLEIVAPYPDSLRCNRRTYMTMKSYRDLVSGLVSYRKPSHYLDEPVYVDMNPEAIERFVAHARQDASFQYDAFVAKLTAKIGEVDSAELIGNSVWNYSIVRVQISGTTQAWKTQQIINVSKLGKVFNQYPTRQMKHVA